MFKINFENCKNECNIPVRVRDEIVGYVNNTDNIEHICKTAGFNFYDVPVVWSDNGVRIY